MPIDAQILPNGIGRLPARWRSSAGVRGGVGRLGSIGLRAGHSGLRPFADLLRPARDESSASCASHRRGDPEAADVAAGTAMVRAGLGAGGARHRMQAARGRRGETPGQHAGPPRAGASYPAHTHAGAEELHLLEGELWINGRKLVPGDYNYGAPERSTRASGVRRAAPACSSPAPRTFCDDPEATCE